MKYDEDPMDPSNPYWTYPEYFRDNRPKTIAPFKVVHGHFHIQKYENISRAIRIVMLRDPVDNLLSIFFFWKNLFEAGVSGHGLYEFVRKERLSILEFAQIPRVKNLMSETYFGGFDMGRFDIIGTHDQRKSFFDALSMSLGMSFSTMKRENITPLSEERGNIMSDRRTMLKLRNTLADDIRFYEHFSAKKSQLRRFISIPFKFVGR
ncbi:MAG TPA: hypothetical protein VL356_03895 [Acidocella sp.]|jgi:hypothetical protein|nr:hypothetical protein [Acidocella sp.]